jgi:hypothetical protein
MPQLVALSKRYDDKGLQVIGLHVQNATEDEIKTKVKQLKIPFPVTTGGGGPKSGGGIPHSVVFDTSGKMTFEGHPADPDFEKAVKKALKSVAAAGSSSGLGEPKPAGSKLGSSSGLGSSSLGSAAAKPVKPGALIPLRTWKSADGRSMSAALLSVDGANGKFKKSDGTTFTMPLSRLAEDDQKVIEEAAAAPAAGSP